MDWTRRPMSALAPILVICTWASASLGLEKASVRIGDLDRPGEWDAATICEIAYYNYCTGWVWVWGGWSPYEVIGVCSRACCADPRDQVALLATRELIYTAAPPGRHFTGTIDIWGVDENQCPVNLLASRPFYFHSGWNEHSWNLSVPWDFLVTVTCGPGAALPSRFVADHPAAGPTGPQACGTCYQVHRLSHSYFFGTVGAMLCPGEKLNDGVCDVEWIWDVALSCESAVHAGDWFGQASSWAAVKALYR